MKSVSMYLSCFLIALNLSLPTARIIYTLKNAPTETICVTEKARQMIYAPQPIVKYAENGQAIRNPYKAEIDETQICVVEYSEAEEEYLAAPEIEFTPFMTYVYNGTRKKLPASESLQSIVRKTAEIYELPHRIVLALLGVETTWNENADHVETHNGARYIGIGCVNEKYHAESLANKGINIYTLAGNVEGVCWLLKAQYDRFGTIELALMAYNGGAGYVQWATERGIYENGYTRTVMGYAESFE